MTTHDDLDGLIRDQLRAEAPGRAPAGLLEAAMERIDSTSQRRRGGFLGGTPGRLLAAAAVLVLAVVAGTQLAGLIERPSGTGGSASPSPSPSQAPAASARPSPSASSGAADQLLLRLVVSGGGPTHPAQLLPWFTLMADGTVIWHPVPAETETGSLVVRRLTPSGLDELTQRIFGNGLLDQSAEHDLGRRPGAPEPPGRGVSVYRFTARDGEAQTVVSSVQWLGDEEESTYYQPSPERRELDELARALRDPESLVDADAWDGPAEPYIGADYPLVLNLFPGMPPYGTIDASEIPWPFDGLLDEFGEAVEGPGRWVTRCGVIPRADAQTIIAALEAAGFEEVGLDRATVGSLDWAEGDGTVDLFLMPRMPDGYPECADLATAPPG